MTKSQYKTIAKDLCYGNEVIDALERAVSNAERDQIMITARERKMEKELRWSNTKLKPSQIGVAVYQSISALIA